MAAVRDQPSRACGRFLLALAAPVALLLLACARDGADRATPTPEPASTGRPSPSPAASPAVTFAETGALVRDNPGWPPGVWFLVYERPGAPALSTALEFTLDSVCISAGRPLACDGLAPGTRVRVQGTRLDGGVRVLTLSVQGEADRPASVVVQVFFLDEQRFAEGTVPVVVAVDRRVEPPAVAAAALDALFAGPTAEEAARGLRLEASGASGARIRRIDDGVAHVDLLGGCDSRGSVFTVAQLVIPTLTQFPTVDFVKLYDPQGSTAEPEGRSNSIPACLEP